MTSSLVRVSISFFAMPAICPPYPEIILLSVNVDGFLFFKISDVVASANIFRISSILVILSRRFSFFSPLNSLYSRVVIPAQACVMTSVRIANCTPSFNPLLFHWLRLPLSHLGKTCASTVLLSVCHRFICQVFAHLDAFQPLINPAVRISQAFIFHHCPIDCKFRILHFVQTFPCHLCHP